MKKILVIGIIGLFLLTTTITTSMVTTLPAWTTTEVVSTESTWHAAKSSLAVGPDKTIHVAWLDTTICGGWGDFQDIFYKMKPNGGSWTTTEIISSDNRSGLCEEPSLAVDSEGNVHIAWKECFVINNETRNRYIFYKMKSNGENWTTTEVVSTESNITANRGTTSLSIGLDDSVHIVWQDHTYYDGCGPLSDIFYKMKPNGGSWTTTEVVSTECIDSSYSSEIAIGQDGAVHVIWSDMTDYNGCGGGYSDIFYKMKPNGGSWTTTEVVSTESVMTADKADMVVAVDNTVHVVYKDRTMNPDRIIYKMKPIDGSWSDAEVVASDVYGPPSLDIGNDGTIHVAWDNTHDILYKMKLNGESWTTTEVVSTESYDNSFYPSIAVDSDGKIHVAWHDYTDLEGSGQRIPDIFYKCRKVCYPPDKPTIDGPLIAEVGVEYEYTFVTTDPEEDDVSYFVDWGDDTTSGWTDYVTSGTMITLTHTWEERGIYIIRAKAQDIHGIESDWRILPIIMPDYQVTCRSVPSSQTQSQSTPSSTQVSSIPTSN